MEEPFIKEEQELQLEQRLLMAADISYARPSIKRKVRAYNCYGSTFNII